ncbi:MAG: DUF58 domain-containing protein [Chitinophagales bacterium]|nr:DUF58 domain-containing protein [Bacteroidota bacterium]MCB9043605.1 DUF58 domain-containing protein [Chitinophagales bacterium]
METAELLKKVRKIEIKTKGLSNHIFSGEYHSTFKGRGMSFSEVREYHFGDDIRNIDWNVTARFNAPYVKVFEEERELTLMLLVDVSPSAYFGTLGQLKNELMAEICAVLAFSATKNNDKVGLLFFSDKIELFIPPKKGKSHILRLIREIVAYKPQSKTQTDIAFALKHYNNLIKKRSIVFLLSDFIAAGYQKDLGLAARKHDLIGLRIYDPIEQQLPQVGMLQVSDTETDQHRWLDTNNAAERKAWHQYYQTYLQYCTTAFVQSAADLINISTDQHRKPYTNELIRFFQKRR